MNHPTGRLAAVLIFLLITPSFVSGAISQKDRSQTYKQLELFSNILSMLQENYVDEIDSEDILNGAIKGLLFSLDPHSSYLSPERFQDLQEETRGTFTGIGIEVTIKNDQLTVVTPIAETPAEKAGLKPNDIIVEINGIKAKNMGSYDAVQELRGPVGTEVTLSIRRKGWEKSKEFTLKRERIPLQSVKIKELSKGLVYCRISQFQSHTTAEFRKQVKQYSEKEPIKGMVLDLRSNPGGLLHQAVSLADMFLKKGSIVSTRGRRTDQNTTYSAHASSNEQEYPLVVLVNEGSASAAEIVAGAIQAHKRGILVGTRTFGKGSVQTIIPLPDGAGLRMTTARYYTPDGKSIQALGIQPDVEVPFIACKPEKVKKTTKGQVTEADLDRHLQAGSAEEKEAAEEAKARQKLDTWLSKDNQLKTAYNILKSLNLYSEYTMEN